MGAIRNNVTLSLGLVSMTVSIHSAVQDVDGASLFCEGGHDDHEAHEPTKTTQPLFCPSCNSRKRGQFARYMDLGGDQWAKIPTELEEEIAALATACKSEIKLDVRPAVQVAESTLAGEKVYYLAPSAATAKVYSLFVHVLRKRVDVALVGEFAIKGVPALYQLSVLNDALSLRELSRPERILPAPAVPNDFDASLEGQLDAALTARVAPFKATDYADQRQAKLTAFVAKAQGVQVATPEKQADNSNVIDLSAALAAMIAETAEPTAAKPTARKRAPRGKGLGKTAAKTAAPTAPKVPAARKRTSKASA